MLAKDRCRGSGAGRRCRCICQNCGVAGGKCPVSQRLGNAARTRVTLTLHRVLPPCLARGYLERSVTRAGDLGRVVLAHGRVPFAGEIETADGSVTSSSSRRTSRPSHGPILNRCRCALPARHPRDLCERLARPDGVNGEHCTEWPRDSPSTQTGAASCRRSQTESILRADRGRGAIEDWVRVRANEGETCGSGVIRRWQVSDVWGCDVLRHDRLLRVSTQIGLCHFDHAHAEERESAKWALSETHVLNAWSRATQCVLRSINLQSKCCSRRCSRRLASRRVSRRATIATKGSGSQAGGWRGSVSSSEAALAPLPGRRRRREIGCDPSAGRCRNCAGTDPGRWILLHLRRSNDLIWPYLPGRSTFFSSCSSSPVLFPIH